ncbi:DNA repair exonuclease [Halobacteriales archaeon QS_4_69_34]|nr:MAG: DNA repair exonuclease [Halobacteriales archaeon QS_4_69_34]
MTTILHVSDTHLGKRQYGSDVRREDFAAAFEQVVAIAVGEHPDHDAGPVDAVIHTGDLFDSRTPPLPEITRSVGTLRRLADAGVPFYAIVGNHDRKLDTQWLDLIAETGTAKRLGRTPTIVGEGRDAVALYGVDSVTKPAWDDAEFGLVEPETADDGGDEMDEVDGDGSSGPFRLLCLHQLLHPPVPEIMADYSTGEALSKAGIDVDALALGDYHAPEETVVDGTPVWYAGSTERCSAGEEATRSVRLLDIEAGDIERTRLELDTRAFRSVRIEFAAGDGHGHAERELDRHDLSGAVARIGLLGERTSLASSAVYELAMERGAAVCTVTDDRGRDDIDTESGPTGAVKRPDTLIEERLAEAELSDATRGIEARARGDADLATSRVDAWAEERIRAAQAAAFGEGNPEGVNSGSGGDVEADPEENGTADETDWPDEQGADPDPASDASAAGDNGGAATAGTADADATVDADATADTDSVTEGESGTDDADATAGADAEANATLGDWGERS